jgi:elongation factor G
VSTEIDYIDFDPEELGEPLRTVVRAQRGHARFVRQRGDVMRFGEVKVVVAPHPGTHCFRFVWQAGSSLPKPFMRAACLKGIKEALLKPLRDGERIGFVQVSVVDGSWHDVDTDEMSLAIAAAMAVQDALSRADLIDVQA